MRRIIISLSLLALALSPVAAPAQQQPGGDTGGIPKAGPTAPDSRLRAMYEDIEILRRLLIREVVRPEAFAFSPDGKIVASAGEDRVVRIWDTATGKLVSQSGAAHLPEVEGFYLKGQGVVYSLTLPPSREPVKSTGAAAPPAKQPPGEWEQIRKQMRGEKVEHVPAAAPARPALGEALLRLLAKHGHNFSHLGPNESITIAVTFRGAAAAAPPKKQPQQPGGAPHTGGGWPGTERVADLDLLADLHLRNGKAKEALEVLGRAIQVYQPSGESPERFATLHRKVAQALLMLANTAEPAERWKLADRAAEMLAKAAAAPAAAPARLPARLIVAAKKVDLDRFAAGKMSFDELYRTASTVVYETFPTAEKAAGK